MSKYVCSICGYIYDELKEGVKFDDLPSSWTCPLCGAPKNAFNKFAEEQQAAPSQDVVSAKVEPTQVSADRQLTNAELNVLCTNLAKGCDKQYKAAEVELFSQIADYYKKRSQAAAETTVEDIVTRLNSDLKSNFASAFDAAKSDKDRGALRVLTWSEKVSKIVDSLLTRYKKEGVAFLQGAKIFVCEICGFIYIGNEAPEICPICKVPKFKINEVGRV